MFGLNDNDSKQKDQGLEAVPADPAADSGATDGLPVVEPTSDPSSTAPPPFPVPADTPIPVPPPTPSPVPPLMEAIPSPAVPQAAAELFTAEATMPEETGLSDSPEPPKPKKISKRKKAKDDDTSAPPPVMAGPQEEDLLKLKQDALQSLAPLVDQLDQSPEEKFRTTMMLIQASDNADLVHEAYESANQITDEKVRAQALLDVVNEINYFTQHQAPETHPEE